jgi:FkbM family methyltransferase
MFKSFSQYGQDEYIFKTFFSNKKDGLYVDIGAYDGVKLSNTYAFDNLGWHGYCFEPIEEVFSELLSNRPNAKNFNLAIGHKTDKVIFLKVSGQPEMLSGVLDYYDNQHLLRINREVFETGGSKDGVMIDMVTLDSIVPLDTHIDYLSLDTEGGESLILENILQTFTPSIISIEVNYQEELNKLTQLTSGRYDIVKQLGCDLILKLK